MECEIFGKTLIAQNIMKNTYEAEYDLAVLKSEDVQIRAFAEGYNNCLSHLRQTLIMQYGARPLTRAEQAALAKED